MGGTLIDFEQLIAGHRSVSQALRSLSSQYPAIAAVLGTTFSQNTNPSANDPNLSQDISPVQIPVPSSPPKLSRRARLTQAAVADVVVRSATTLFSQQLWNPAHASALRYLMDVRGLSEPTLRAFDCGFATPGVTDLTRALQSQGHSADHVALAGLSRQTRTGDWVDILRNRVITPIRTMDGNVVAFAGRTLPGAPAREPKYLNGPETVLFKKSSLLFGADLARAAPSARADEDGYVIVVEGYMDVMTMFERTQGRVACVAAMGTALSSTQLDTAYGLLEDVVDGRVIINFDADDAGISAVQRLCEKVIPTLRCAHAVYVAMPPPPVKDADEFLRVVGKADEYVMYLLESAVPWYQWLGDRVVATELQRLQTLSPEEVLNEDIAHELVSQAPDAGFDFSLGDFLRAQRDDLLVAYGASAGEINKYDPAKQRLPKVDDAVLDRLADILVSAQRRLPGLNSGALVKSWADALSRSQPSELLPLFRGLLDRASNLSKEWSHLSVPEQVYWMPPAPWMVDELPSSKRKAVKQASGYNSKGEIDMQTILSDPALMKRSRERIEYQNEKIMPVLKGRQTEESRMLKEAPRRCAEEIILRCLIFATEEHRLDALSAVMEVMIRCQEKNLPFWTSGEREALFEYLAAVEGPTTPDEMAASLEDCDWFITEIEALFSPVADEADEAWRDIRELELGHPVAIATSTAMSVEVMAGKVASRMALEESGRVMEKLVEIQSTQDQAGSTENREKQMEDVRQLVAKEVSLRREVDQTRFLSPEELEMREKELNELRQDSERKRMQTELLGMLERNEDIPLPDWME